MIFKDMPIGTYFYSMWEEAILQKNEYSYRIVVVSFHKFYSIGDKFLYFYEDRNIVSKEELICIKAYSL